MRSFQTKVGGVSCYTQQQWRKNHARETFVLVFQDCGEVLSEPSRLKSSFYLFKSSSRTLCFLLIYPHLQYCNIVWASMYPTNLRRLVLLQKRVDRILNKSKFDANTDSIFKELKLLKFQDILFFQLGQFMFSYKNSSLPTTFNNLFSTNNQIHTYNTRSAQNLHCYTQHCVD